MQADLRHTRWLWLILLLGLALRLAYMTDLPTRALFRHGGGGDSGWYLVNGAGFYSGQEHGWVLGLPFYVSAIPTAPFYILYTGFFQQFLPKHEAIVAMRLVQAFIGTATAYLAFRIGWVITRQGRTALLAAALTALHPALIIEAGTIATETCYIFFLMMGLWLYIEYVVPAAKTPTPHRLKPAPAIVLMGIAFGLASLTRAVFLLFPIGIALHFLLLSRRGKMPNGPRRSLLLLLVYAAVVLTWTFYNIGMWNRFVIVSDQFMPALWRAAADNDGSPQENDRLLMVHSDETPPADCTVDCKFSFDTETYLTGIQATVNGDITVFLSRRWNEWTYALLQPHGTVPLGKVSVMAAAQNWLQNQRSLSGLLQLIQIEGFAPKLVVWLFHYAALVLGLAGMWLSRKAWHLTLPLVGFVAYTALVHFILLALPRYLFPIELPLLIFAAIALTECHTRLVHKRSSAKSESSSL